MIFAKQRLKKTDNLPKGKDQSNVKPYVQLEEYIANRDFSGAVAMLEFYKESGQTIEEYPTLPWLGYSAFHLGEYQKAMQAYQEMLESDDADPILHIYVACCSFYLGQYKEAEEAALKGPVVTLQNRLLFHIAHKFNDENKLMVYHQKLQETLEDQLSLASIHYFRNHFQEATDIYKRILLENRDYLALNVYVALCYYKLDYYDVSLEVLNVYLQSYPNSAIAINLKACNNYRLYNGKVAEQELKVLLDLQSVSFKFENDLVKHNLVVFKGGENALQVLPPVVDLIPEARLNLVIYHLRNEEVQEAYQLIKDLEPVTPQEYILKGVVNASIGQLTDSREHIKMAQQYFQLVGASASECDTIPGRQCMASCFFLLKQFEDVLIYLTSIKTYFPQDDDFNWNIGIAQAAAGQYKDALETLQLIQNEKYKVEYCYISWLARCYVMTQQPKKAWELYLKMDTSNESFSLLQLIANDAYKSGSFYYSAKAFDVLERLDPNPEYWDGKRGACVGVFQQVIANKEPADALRDVVGMLRNSRNNQVDTIVLIMKTWAKQNGIKLG
jgi:intraflagellar transport protein 56|uniref:Intraflagellar transport protein 56 n=1 Tax=Eutreptiella gymnastica TaxID=73025 RepID=A0A7S4FKV4_9EUGL|mmetsp:Transcript_60934/g.100801  ORF Transcript_60934/g.100801 Transcript_60934/m.100801 type:complete len:557 (+) Transcript_60934:143-1813(+)|eukprot:CAMPEP_0174282798 /NCGR_PEP_ID=MMETSP0809-20121228/3363_1 /TAXON_ID=73025 ORGANISM="Eutreptiella gymnastica-like, Strain CCMP1594" /NCGR_SAMPLE_ID=MMETSP0809 /ASSEMBLY_ACC=CAM_ASM_000658 /LENGTH=556 /DNA_ID=CAMNT_0015377255 /DNA_START=115 /DNA_END=1785 /DNA_ORIENTATION=-